MTEYCKHGIDMRITCRKCGRIMQVEVPFFAAKRYAFTNSIQRLEETVRKMQIDLARPRHQETAPDAEPSRAVEEKSEAPGDQALPPPPPPETPPQRYPWQRG